MYTILYNMLLTGADKEFGINFTRRHFCWNVPKHFSKNVAYGRHQIFWQMGLVAPIFLFLLAAKRGLKAFFFAKKNYPSPPRACVQCGQPPRIFGLHARARDAPHQATNKGCSAPVHTKQLHGKGTNTRTDIATTRSNRHSGPIRWKNFK